MRVFLLLIGTIALVMGVKFIYDARPIVKKYFGMGDKNEATFGLKLMGFLLSIIGSALVLFNF